MDDTQQGNKRQRWDPFDISLTYSGTLSCHGYCKIYREKDYSPINAGNLAFYSRLNYADSGWL